MQKAIHNIYKTPLLYYKMKKEDIGNKDLGIISFILGLLSIVLIPLSFLFVGVPSTIILGIIGIIFAVMQRKKGNNKYAAWGLWLSIIGIIANFLIFLLLLKAMIEFAGQIQQLQASGAFDQAALAQIPAG